DWPAGLTWEEFRVRAAQTRREWRPDAPSRLLLAVQRERTDLERLLAAARGLLAKQPEKSSWRSPEGAFYGSGPAPGKLAVLFPGQGAQYPGMLRDLACHFPAAHDTLAEADRAFAAGRPGGPRLGALVYPVAAFPAEARAADESALRATEVAQPALGAVSLGAWAVLGHFGVRADAFAGHSFGELAALCAAGRLAPADLHALARARGRLMAEAGGAAGAGGMLAVQAAPDAVAEALR